MKFVVIHDINQNLRQNHSQSCSFSSFFRWIFQICLNILSPSHVIITNTKSKWIIFPSITVADSSSSVIRRIRCHCMKGKLETNTAGGKKYVSLSELTSEESTFPFCTHYNFTLCGWNVCLASKALELGILFFYDCTATTESTPFWKNIAENLSNDEEFSIEALKSIRCE